MHDPYPGGSRQPVQPDRYWRDGNEPADWRDGEWFRPQPDQERGPAPGERGRGGRHQRHGGRRRPDPDQTKVLEPQSRALESRPQPPVPRPQALVVRPQTLEPRSRVLMPRFTLDLRATAVDLPALATGFRERKVGRNSVLIAGTVFFLIDTLLMADGFAKPEAIGSRVLVIFIWLVSLGAVALLWLRAAPRQSALVRALWARLRTAPRRRHAGQ